MKVLFVTSTRIGDAILTTGVLSYLLERYPQASFTVACGPLAAPLFPALPRLEQILLIHKRPYDLHWLELWAKCAPHRWDVVVDMRSSLLSFGLFARERHIYQRWHRSKGGHKVEQYGRVLRDPQETPNPRVWTTAEHHEKARRLVPTGKPVIGFGPTTSWEGKQWPIPRYVELVKRLIAPDGMLPGARIALFGTASEREILQTIIDVIPPQDFVDIIGKGDLLTAAACLQRCHFFIANDTGLMHLAAAAGVPTLGLFGPSRKEVYGPWGECTGVAETAVPAEELISQIGRSTGTLMESLPLETVEAAARALWARCACQKSKGSPSWADNS